MTELSDSDGKPRVGAVFATTHWSVVMDAAGTGSQAVDQALAQLCETYWFPLYAYVRRQGHKPDEAQDLTQEFFRRLLAGNYLKTVDPKKGRFRSFLLGAMEHFLAKQWRDARRQKRGGGQPVLSLDDGEARYSIEPGHETAPEHLFERKWALTLIDRAFQRLRQEFVSAGKLPMFEALQPFLTGDRTDSTYASIATQLDMTEGAVKVAVHRLRARYGGLVRDEIAKTVSKADEVNDELRYLLEVLGR